MIILSHTLQYYLETKINENVENGSGDESNSQYSLVFPPHRVLHHGRDGVLVLLHHIHHVCDLCVPEDIRPGPGQYGSRLSTLSDSWLASEYEEIRLATTVLGRRRQRRTQIAGRRWRMMSLNAT